MGSKSSKSKSKAKDNTPIEEKKFNEVFDRNAQEDTQEQVAQKEDEWEARARSKNVDQNLLQSELAQLFSFKILLLGAGESGKSTILKQLESIHNHKIRKFQVENIITSLHENALDCMRSLFQALDNYGLKVESREAARIMVKFLRSPMCKFIEKVFRMFWNDTNLGVQNVLNFLPQRPLTFKPYIKVIRSSRPTNAGLSFGCWTHANTI
mmetsp:Transcript_10379/g.14479  ORF Transcript_10379/g.14479 Transcript_10379/m.14479 type:complete len:210 (-) Transcript_10379:877-1506(-)